MAKLRHKGVPAFGQAMRVSSASTNVHRRLLKRCHCKALAPAREHWLVLYVYKQLRGQVSREPLTDGLKAGSFVFFLFALFGCFVFILGFLSVVGLFFFVINQSCSVYPNPVLEINSQGSILIYFSLFFERSAVVITS